MNKLIIANNSKIFKILKILTRIKISIFNKKIINKKTIKVVKIMNKKKIKIKFLKNKVNKKMRIY